MNSSEDPRRRQCRYGHEYIYNLSLFYTVSTLNDEAKTAVCRCQIWKIPKAALLEAKCQPGT